LAEATTGPLRRVWRLTGHGNYFLEPVTPTLWAEEEPTSQLIYIAAQQ
jgi:hypothetical protein